MFAKYGKLLLFIIIIMFLVSAVSAADNIDGELRDKKDVSDLETAIDNAPDGSTLYLNNTYYSDGSGSPNIVIDKTLRIDGSNGNEGYSIIDGKNNNWHIEVRRGNVIFINIKFVNMHAGEFGGAVHFMEPGSVLNCTFVNCSVADFGGAVCDAHLVANCTFISCHSRGVGGAIGLINPSSIINCSFINCSSIDGGGAVYSMDDVPILNCTFLNCHSGWYEGGAICSIGSIANCTFVNCYARFNGGAISFQRPGSVVNCTFLNCISYGSGGAVSFAGSILRCLFVNCSAASKGGAVYFKHDCSLEDCTFMNCSASAELGAVIYVRGSLISLKNNTVDSNTLPIYLENSHVVSPCFLSSINCSSIYGSFNRTMALHSVLTDDKGNIIGSNAKVKLMIGGTEYEGSFNGSSKTFKTDFTPMHAGILLANGNFTGCSNLTVAGGIIIVGMTEMSVKVENGTWGEPVKGKIILRDAFDNPVNGIVIIVIDGMEMEIALANGTADFVFDKPLKAGEHAIEVIYAGNDTFMESNASGAFTLDRLSTKMELNVTAQSEGSVLAEVTLTDANGNPLSGTVEVSFIGKKLRMARSVKFYEVKVVNGRGQLKITDLAPGSYAAFAHFPGNENLTESYGNAEIAVPKKASGSNGTGGNPWKSNENKEADALSLKTGNPIALLLLAILIIPVSRKINK